MISGLQLVPAIWILSARLASPAKVRYQPVMLRRASYYRIFPTASSLLEELRRNREDLLVDVAVVDFNPLVTRPCAGAALGHLWGHQPSGELIHAGVTSAQILIARSPTRSSKAPPTLSSSGTSERSIRSQDRGSDRRPCRRKLADAAGADYVSVAASRKRRVSAECSRIESSSSMTFAQSWTRNSTDAGELKGEDA
jgi:hypothetical protein